MYGDGKLYLHKILCLLFFLSIHNLLLPSLLQMWMLTFSNSFAFASNSIQFNEIGIGFYNISFLYLWLWPLRTFLQNHKKYSCLLGRFQIYFFGSVTFLVAICRLFLHMQFIRDQWSRPNIELGTKALFSFHDFFSLSLEKEVLIPPGVWRSFVLGTLLPHCLDWAWMVYLSTGWIKRTSINGHVISAHKCQFFWFHQKRWKK